VECGGSEEEYTRSAIPIIPGNFLIGGIDIGDN
jgi:hypothetical protein